MIFLCAPIEHVGGKIDTCALTKGLDDPGRIVQQIVGIYNAHLDPPSDSIRGVVSIACRSSIGSLTCSCWPNLADGAKIIEQAAQLIVSRLGWHEVIEPSDPVQWRDTAAVVGRNTRTWVPDQEGEVEVPQCIPRDHGRVVGLSIRVERIRSLGGASRGTVDDRFDGSNATLDSA